MNTMVWADYHSPISMSFFLITKDIYNIENIFIEHTPDTRWNIKLYNGVPKIQRDSLHNTRRFEYPWAFLNISSNCDSLLDMGSGGSSFTFFLTQFIDKVVALDKNPETINEVELIKKCTGRFHNLETKCADLLNSGYEDNSFDTVISISTLEHVGRSNLEKAFDELFRIARKTILVTMDVRFEPYEERIHLEDLKQLSKKYGFNIPTMNQPILAQVLEKDKPPFVVACIRIEKDNVK